MSDIFKAKINNEWVGIPALQGEQGPQGIQGVQGERGPRGEQGPMGPQGAQGPTGAQGPQGNRGQKGEQGEQGIKGDKGDQGIQGIQGPKGAKGDKGDTGATGAAGSPASVTVGTTTTGRPGTSAMVTNVGTAQNAVLNFRVPQGPKGDTGNDGQVQDVLVSYDNGQTWQSVLSGNVAEIIMTGGGGGGGAGEINKINKIQKNGVDLPIVNKVVDITVPTATSELTNDSGFITSATIPTRTSDLINDSGFITTWGQADWNETDTTSPSYIDNKPTIPQATMDGTDRVNFYSAWMTGVVTSDITSTYIYEHLLPPSDAQIEYEVNHATLHPSHSTLAQTQIIDLLGLSSYTYYLYNKLASIYATQASLAPVATSGLYNDLIERPYIPHGTNDVTDNDNFLYGSMVQNIAMSAVYDFKTHDARPTTLEYLQIYVENPTLYSYHSDWNYSNTIDGECLSSYSYYLQQKLATIYAPQASLAPVATSGDYNDLSNKPAIHNIPSGGTTGQFLVKTSSTDYDAEWIDLPVDENTLRDMGSQIYVELVNNSPNDTKTIVLTCGVALSSGLAIDWGDGTSIVLPHSYSDQHLTHTYEDYGVYTITFYGNGGYSHGVHISEIYQDTGSGTGSYNRCYRGGKASIYCKEWHIAQGFQSTEVPADLTAWNNFEWGIRTLGVWGDFTNSNVMGEVIFPMASFITQGAMNNSNITSIVLPRCLMSVSNLSLSSSLERLEVKAPTPPTLTNTTIPSSCKVFVPWSADHSVLNAYKTSSRWSTYASQIYEKCDVDAIEVIQKNGTPLAITNQTVNITVPTATSELTNDSNFVSSSSLATVATSGSYNDLSNKPTIPYGKTHYFNQDWTNVGVNSPVYNLPSNIPANEPCIFTGTITGWEGPGTGYGPTPNQKCSIKVPTGQRWLFYNHCCKKNTTHEMWYMSSDGVSQAFPLICESGETYLIAQGSAGGGVADSRERTMFVEAIRLS